MTTSRPQLLDITGSVILYDSVPFLEQCAQQNFITKDITKTNHLDENSIVFSFTDNAAKRTFELAKLANKKRCIFCPIHVFEASTKNALYTLSQLIKSDIGQCLIEQRKTLELVNCKTPLKLVSPRSKSTVTISNNATPYAILEEDLLGDFVHSVAEFFEVHFAHMKPQDPCPFSVEGELRVSGILTVLRKKEGMPPLIADSLNTLIREVASKQAVLQVNANKVISFKVGNQEFLELIQRAAGPRGAYLTEFAIGVNRAITPLIDFSINSQMNEGVSGVHVALGDGTTGYHIDFLCPGVVVETG